MTYGKNYFEKLFNTLDKKNVSSETLFMLSKINIEELADSDSSLANTDLNTIFLPSMKKVMKLIESSNSDVIKDMELLIVKQQEILESIVDHEVAHTLEYVYKKVGMTLYNSILLPKLLNGSLGIYDEKSFEDNKDIMRDLLINEFIKSYNPNDYDLKEFKKFVYEYYIPNGPFGLIDKISIIDNYVIDIYIENDIINIVPNKDKMDNKFINMRKILYDNNENEYSIYRCLQLYIDPRFENNEKYMNKINNNKLFDDFINLDVSNLKISNDLFLKTNPNLENLTIKDVLKEIKEIISNVRTFNDKDSSYLDYKFSNSIDSKNISLLTSKLAKIIYIKQLEFEGDKEKEIKDIIKNDSTFDLNEEDYSKGESQEESNDELSKELNSSYEESIKNMGHNNDFASEVSDFMQESLSDISNHLNTKILANSFEFIGTKDMEIIPSILRKECSYEHFKSDDKVSDNRFKLLQEIKDDSKFTYLEELLEEFKTKIGAFEYKNNSVGNTYNIVDDYINGNEFMYSLSGNSSLNIYLHCFIDDSISMSDAFDSNYSKMDYQITNIMLLIELLKEIEGLEIIVTNFPKKDNSINIIYDSLTKNDVDISSIVASKVASPLYQSILESNIYMKSVKPDSNIINVFMSDGDDNMNPKNINVSNEFFKEIIKDSYFLQLNGEENLNISDKFDSNYFIINQNPIEHLIRLAEEIVEKLEKNILFQDNDKKNVKYLNF